MRNQTEGDVMRRDIGVDFFIIIPEWSIVAVCKMVLFRSTVPVKGSFDFWWT